MASLRGSRKVSRRDFLKSALTRAVILATQHVNIQAQAGSNERILIIGAGMAIGHEYTAELRELSAIC